MSNLHIPKIKSFTKEENQILQSIIKSKDKIVVHTKEQMDVYKKFIQLLTSDID